MDSTETFRERYGWQFVGGEPAVPGEWLPAIEPLCTLVNDTIPQERRGDFKMDVYCDRGDYPMSVDIQLMPSDIEMGEIDRLAGEAEESVRAMLYNLGN